MPQQVLTTESSKVVLRVLSWFAVARVVLGAKKQKEEHKVEEKILTTQCKNVGKLENVLLC